MKIILLMCFIASLVGIAAYNFLCYGKDIPTGKASKMMMLAGKRSGSRTEGLFDVYIAKVSALFAPIINLDIMKRSELENALAVADIEMTPEEFMADSISRAVLLSLCSIPLCFLNPLFLLLGVGLGCLYGFYRYQTVLDNNKKRRARIEMELPRFAQAISQNVQGDRDVLRMLMSYRRVAERDFADELDRTIADMKTGNYETALLKLEKRVNSPQMSEVIRGLIGTLRGEDQAIYFKMICFDLRQMEQNALKKEALKRPRAMQKYSMFMMLCILIIYAVVLATEVMSALNVLF